MAKILVMVITGKDNIQKEMVAFNFSLGAVKNANAIVEMLFIGQGVQALNKGQANSHQFKEQIEKAVASGITLKACINSLKNEGLDEQDIFPGIDLVLGGVEANKKIEEGYSVISF